MAERMVVIGGDAGGMTAASQARRRRSPDDLSIVAFEQGNFISYSACGIPYFVGGVVAELDSLLARRSEVFREKYSIEPRLSHEVLEIDFDGRALKVRSNSGESSESFDQLVIATGAVPLRPPLEGADAPGIFGVQTLDHGVAVKRWVEERKPRCAVVVGGGYIGLEMAEAFKALGMETTVVERASQPMPTLDPDMGALVADAIREMGITVHTEEPVTGFEMRDGHVSAVITEGHPIPADIVALGLGVRPNTDLARAAGIEIGDSGGIAVDSKMRASVEGVWAAGDCAEKFHLVSRKPVSIALGTHANKEGRVAGINIGGGNATFPGVLGTAASKVCEVEVARTGLKESEGEAAGFATVSATIESTTRAGYYPGKSRLKIKMVAEKGSGRLLGAQIVGREGAAKRIDVLAACLGNEMSVDEIINLDLSYAPPFSPLWDPVLIAARKAAEAVEQAG